MLVDGDKGKDGLIAFGSFAGNAVFHKHIDVYFHAARKGPRYFRFECYHAVLLDRNIEGHVVDIGRDHHAVAMPACRNCRGDVHPLQELSTKEIADMIGIIGQYNFRVGREGMDGSFGF